MASTKLGSVFLEVCTEHMLQGCANNRGLQIHAKHSHSTMWVSVCVCLRRSTCRLSELFRGIISDGVSRDCSSLRRCIDVFSHALNHPLSSWVHLSFSTASLSLSLLFSSLLYSPLSNMAFLSSLAIMLPTVKSRCTTEDSMNYEHASRPVLSR